MSKELAKTYDPKGIEERLYQKWMDNGYFHAKVNPDKKPFTIVMPPQKSAVRNSWNMPGSGKKSTAEKLSTS